MTGGPLRLFVDLGDAFTKSLSVSPGQSARMRFPSVVASRLLRGGAEMAELLVNRAEALPRPPSFEPALFPRTRSYPRAAAFVQRVRERPPQGSPRFAGRIAATYGADRRLLGYFHGDDMVQALVHKALMLSCAHDDCEVEISFVLDTGAKADAISRYAGAPERRVSLELHSYNARQARRMHVTLRGTVVDAPDCIAAALPDGLTLAEVGTLLVIDIGFLRTKLAILSAVGCEQRDALHDLGSFGLVRQILRDGQDQGLVEDEFAVISALENETEGTLTVAGRRFEVGPVLEGARRALEEELTRAAERAIIESVRRGGAACHAVAIVGGGAALVGSGLSRRIQAAGLGIDRVWVAPEPNFLLVEGAAKRHGSSSM